MITTKTLKNYTKNGFLSVFSGATMLGEEEIKEHPGRLITESPLSNQKSLNICSTFRSGQKNLFLWIIHFLN